MIALIAVGAFLLGVIGASVVSATQIGHSEGRLQFQIGELRKSLMALHSVVTDLNQRMERLDA
jgi:hypothetical protein